MGVVYAARDEERGVDVALKTLRQFDPAALLRFKREFRALAGVHHPNLASLYELLEEDGEWFFTMELVDGTHFVRWVRGLQGDAPPSSSSEVETVVERRVGPGLEAPSPAPPRQARGPRPRGELDEGRLRTALPQLVAGVAALHDSGHLHRDIKPSNVLVTPEGRVVLLDFGAVAELTGRGRGRREELVGTPAFMAPELTLGGDLAPASDWYSVGVLLFEALTGRRPFAGRTSEVLADKVLHAPPPPRLLAPEVPEDLDALCVDLLAREPEARPDAREIVAWLAGAPGTDHPSDRTAQALVGRAEELGRLASAFERSKAGQPQVALVIGESGTGKSALVGRFLEGAERDGALVLAGRCYERESVPFKAIDPIVDELTRWLLDRNARERQALLPADLGRLAQSFGVVKRLVADDHPPSALTPQQSRNRAFESLRELLHRVAEGRPTVIFIDDLQWADEDSAPLIESLLRPPAAPPVLWVGASRGGDAAETAVFRALAQGPRLPGAASRSRIDLGPLDPAGAVELAALELQRAGADPERAEALAREAKGNPFFLREMARRARPGGDAPTTLDAMVRARVAELAPVDRALVEAVALAGGPIGREAAFAVARTPRDDRIEALLRLTSSQLLRSGGSGASDRLECYHDRIREAVVAGLDPARRRALHLALAEAIEARGADAESLYEHYLGAGRREEAARHAERAARQAAEALGFERAAMLYARALELGSVGPGEARRLSLAIAGACANAGLGRRAADAYLAAAEGASEQEAWERKREAAAQLLRAGHVEPGLGLLVEVLGRLGIRIPSSPLRAILAFLWQRGRMKLRGLGFERRDPADVPPEALTEVDACWAAATGLAQVEPVLGALFATRSLRAALDAGEPERVARGLLFEAVLTSSGGVRARAATERYLDAGRALVAELDSPALTGFVSAAEGVAAFELGDFGRAYERCERALDEFERNASGSFWEIGTTQLFSALAGLWTFHASEVARKLPRRLADAEQRGDVYTVTCLRGAITPILALHGDDPDGAYVEIQEALSLWGRHELDNQKLMAFIAGCLTDLYAGDLEGGLRRCREFEPAMSRSLLKEVQVIRASWRFLHGLVHVRALVAGHPTRAAAARAARGLLEEGAPWCVGVGELLAAALASASGRDAEIDGHLERAIERLAEAQMAVFEVPARWRLAQRRGDAETVAELEEASRREGAVDPARLLDTFAPPLG